MKIIHVLVLAAAIPIAGCAQLSPDYSLEAYKNATSLKAETGALLQASSSPYTKKSKEIDSLRIKIESAYEFSAGLSSNKLSTAMWDRMRDPDRDLFGGFVKIWKLSGTTSAAFRENKKQQIDNAFDIIICLEANKQKQTPCSSIIEPKSSGQEKPQ